MFNPNNVYAGHHAPVSHGRNSNRIEVSTAPFQTRFGILLPHTVTLASGLIDYGRDPSFHVRHPVITAARLAKLLQEPLALVIGTERKICPASGCFEKAWAVANDIPINNKRRSAARTLQYQHREPIPHRDIRRPKYLLAKPIENGRRECPDVVVRSIQWRPALKPRAQAVGALTRSEEDPIALFQRLQKPEQCCARQARLTM